MNKEREIKRGDLYIYDFGITKGSVQSGRRPVLVLQADNFNTKAPTIIVASVTSVIKKQYLPSHIILGETFGLAKPSMVLLEQLSTVNKSSLIEYVGHIEDEYIWRKINTALKKTFGLWLYERDRTGNIRCLCPKCLRGYMDDPDYIVKRLDPLASKKEQCDKCDDLGWDYLVYDRRTALGAKETYK